jgi:uncharacterized phosphosugar-binding protein
VTAYKEQRQAAIVGNTHWAHTNTSHSNHKSGKPLA